MAKAKAADATTTTYTVNRNLQHDDATYTKGDTVDLTESQAKPLIELGVVSVPASAPETK